MHQQGICLTNESWAAKKMPPQAGTVKVTLQGSAQTRCEWCVHGHKWRPTEDDAASSRALNAHTSARNKMHMPYKMSALKLGACPPTTRSRSHQLGCTRGLLATCSRVPGGTLNNCISQCSQVAEPHLRNLRWSRASRGTACRPVRREDGPPGSWGHNLGGGLGADGVEAVHKRTGERIITQQENKAATAARNFVVMEDRI